MTDLNKNTSGLGPRRQKLFYAGAGTSLVFSLAMLVIALGNLPFAISPLILANWVAFMSTGYLGFIDGFFRPRPIVSRSNHNIWRLVLLAFTGCGLTAFALDAPMF